MTTDEGPRLGAGRPLRARPGRRRAWEAVACLCASVLPWTGPTAAPPVVVELGDPRGTVVTIDDEGEAYRLAVSMVPVRSFDAGSDRQANRDLARAAALSALSKHLKVGPRQELALGGVTAGAGRIDGERFAVAFTAPKSGLEIVDRPDGLARLKIDPEFAPYLLAEPLLMETEGAKLIRLEDGRILVLGVASSALKDGTAADRKRAETIARQRALAHIVAEKTGVQVARAESVEKKTSVTVTVQGEERATSVAEYLETTRSRVQGATRDFPVVGRWTSADGTLFTVAVGGFIVLPKE